MDNNTHPELPNPELPTGFWNNHDLDLFWHYVWWFIKENQIWIMLIAGFLLMTGVVSIIVNIFSPKKHDDEYDIIQT